MDLVRVSRRFDQTPMWDAYTGQKLAAQCQMTAWDNPRRDGLTTIRRTLSVAGNCRFPRRHAVIIGGLPWLISRLDNPDLWGTKINRDGYVAQQALLGINATTAEMLTETGTPTYLSRVWVKDVKDISTTSEAQGQYYVYFTQAEPVQESEFLYVDGRWHLVRNIVSGTAGLMIAECNELEADCVVQVKLQTPGAYNPVTETYDAAAEVVLKAIWLEWRDDYRHGLPSHEAEQTGDERLRFQAADAHHIRGDTRLELRGVTWQVTDIEPRLHGAVSAAIRRV